jgi:tRNA A-37 threonylcarbamoyl transferase component Bud32
LAASFPFNIFLRPGSPDFQDLPWNLSLSEWAGHSSRLEEVTHGVSRHPIVFVNYQGVLYVLKELPHDVAEKEYKMLLKMETLDLPSVTPIGFARTQTVQGYTSVLITQYLEHSIPYRSLFMANSLVRYRQSLLDAVASLLVQLHLAGIYWGDCSLSNTLYRQDAGALQAYLVDAETAEYESNSLPPALRYQDLEIMEENVNGDLFDLRSAGAISEGVPLSETGAYIRLRYQKLWEEITHEDIISPGEHYRIQERIRALNALGYSVGEVKLFPTESGNQLRFRVAVTDRNFHRNQLLGLTGLEAEEMQARVMMNEIQELKAMLSRTNNRSSPLSVAAYRWLNDYYYPTIQRLAGLSESGMNPTELYCQVLEHKWYLSERAQRDVGHQAAAEDYLKQFPQDHP